MGISDLFSSQVCSLSVDAGSKLESFSKHLGIWSFADQMLTMMMMLMMQDDNGDDDNDDDDNDDEDNDDKDK